LRNELDDTTESDFYRPIRSNPRWHAWNFEALTSLFLKQLKSVGKLKGNDFIICEQLAPPSGYPTLQIRILICIGSSLGLIIAFREKISLPAHNPQCYITDSSSF
jgi:hypothetical protein